MVIYTKEAFKGAAHRKFCPMAGKIKVADADKWKLYAPASSISIDLEGEIVLPSAIEWSQRSFLRNPIFLWNHDWYGGPEASLGSVFDLKFHEDKVIAGFRYDAGFDPNALLVWNKVQAGSIRGFSIGFRMVAWVTRDSPDEEIESLPPFAREALRGGRVWIVHTKVHLFEISQVLIPCNLDAVNENVQELSAPKHRTAPKEHQQERTEDEMDQLKFATELAGLQSQLKTLSGNQETMAGAMAAIADGMKALAAGVQSNADSIKGIKQPVMATLESKTLTIDDIPDDLVQEIVDGAIEEWEARRG
jgi:phage head maturation protease